MGRKPAGPGLVDGLNGSDHAKERLRWVLMTMRGEATVEEACQALGIHRTRFYELRAEGLQSLLDLYEPRPAGRPRKAAEDPRIEQLEQENERLRLERDLAEMKAELRLVLEARPAQKKTPDRPARRSGSRGRSRGA